MAPIPRSFEEQNLRPLDRMTISDLLLLGGYDATDVLAEILGLLLESLETGIISIDLTRPTSPDISMDDSAARHALSKAEFLAKYKKGDYTTLVATAPDSDKPLVVVESKGHYRLYFQKYYYHEWRLIEQMKVFRSASVASQLDNTVQLVQSLYEPGRALRKGVKQSPLARDANQTAAIEHSLNSPFTIISGGPGTGKTTVVANLLRCFAEYGIAPERMLLVAPTGRAAQRMTETLKALLQSISEPTPEDMALRVVQAQTVHTALRYQHPGQFRHTSSNPMPKDVVILDEASMVDVVLMSQFISALKPSTTRLILLGDPDQLPAVAAGSIFARLTVGDPSKALISTHHVVLQKGYRSGSELTRLARQVRHGIFPDHQPESVTTAFLISGDDRKRPQQNTNIQIKPQPVEAVRTKPSKSWCRLASAELKNWPTALKAWAGFYQADFDQKSRNALDLLRQRSVGAFSQPDPSVSEIIALLLENVSRGRILTLVHKGPWGCEDINGFLKPLLADSLDQGGDPDRGIFAGMPMMITRNDRENGLFNGDVGIVVALKEGYYTVFQTSGQYVALPVSHLAAWEPAMAITVHKSQGSEYKHVFLVLPDDPSHRLLSRELIYTAITRTQKQLVIWGNEKVLQRAMTRKVIAQVDPLLD